MDQPNIRLTELDYYNDKLPQSLFQPHVEMSVSSTLLKHTHAKRKKNRASRP